ncbi:hypothetical protein [Chryseobacterium luteum]|uniref:Uncharacterized protein n=1 Tax=Chryseobacterium luteum TaxID=421531 RepID=A0A085ZU45_9FLAO|nr:hypothetical protein [Chryseobacterium luteum]KFF07959.1 hypothetical protein IX38_07275 [Chryseobacterium luteum]
MKNIYLLIAFSVVVSCKKRDTLDDVYMNTDSISTDTTYQASTTIFNDSANSIQDTASIESIKPKYAIIWAIIAPNSDSVLTKENMSRYQSIGSDVIEMMDISEDAKYKKMDEFEKTLYHDRAIPAGMNIRKRKILVFDTYAETSKQREEFIK